MIDLVLAGGGLANSLLALRLKATRPDISFVLLEGGAQIGGNHTWSWHGTDVTAEQRHWLESYASMNWHAHDVMLPGVQRTIGGGYHSLKSEDLHRHVLEALRDRVRLKARVKEVKPTEVTLESGERVEARCVIDARGFPPGASEWPCGYQKFLGMELLLKAPHGLERPLLMDATVEQLDGFRFLYALPWSERTVLVEDTYYSNTPDLDADGVRKRIAQWVSARGWQVEGVGREELAALPIPLSGEAPVSDHPTIGVAAGLFHATTGYSFPFAIDVAWSLAQLPAFDAHALTAHLNRLAAEHWSGQGFFRLLNRMLFRGAAPETRARVFASFYKQSEETIARFYAGRLTWSDKLSTLRHGAPTVPALKAMRAALG